MDNKYIVRYLQFMRLEEKAMSEKIKRQKNG